MLNTRDYKYDATMVSGATFIILITPSSEMRFVPPCSIYFSKNLTPLLKLLKPFATLNINMVFMFMINLISVTKKLSLNTLADILDALLSLLPESIITMADRLLFIIIAMKMNSMFRKQFLPLILSKGSSAISKEKHHFFLSLNKWRTAICASFGYDPLLCPSRERYRRSFL